MVSLLGWSIWEYFTCFFDYIPKIMYFLYAALASCLDAMQCLLRRLAGLDVHYLNGQPVTDTDPVLSFIMGILGIGENSGDYSVLTTTFWSLAIFGLIVLALSTFVAIIKSHYNDDGGKTAPMTYVYTAFKSILTFAIVPVVIIAGFWLSSFLLRTLDNITTGAATEESLQGIYGTNYNTVFKAQENSKGEKVYSQYDFFSFGSGSTSETFSGLIFKTAAHGANRVRTGSHALGAFYNFDILGEYTPAGQNTTEWTAYQIDYAFANCLEVNNITWAPIIYAGGDNNNAAKAFITITSIDAFAMTGIVHNFSKYNVGLVWYYYNLWQFNFIVGFAAIITCFMLMISIILGLMTRIIKTVALFLIYPGVLGLAPLDDWGAFKKWRREFQQQVLMAFGAIIGMNLFFLIFPYLSNISFFNIGLLDYMVNIVIVITGLVMVKGFIGFMSGLVGGADALAAGDGVKGEVGKTLSKGAGMALGAANVAMKVGKFIPGAGMAVGAAQKGLRIAIAKGRANAAARQAASAQADVTKADLLQNEDSTEAQEAAENLSMANSQLAMARNAYSASDEGQKVEKKLRDKAKRRGLNEDETKAFVASGLNESMLKSKTYRASADDKKQLQELMDTQERQGYSESQWKVIQNRDANAAVAEEATKRAKQIRTANYMTETGEMAPHAVRQMLGNDARAAAGAFGKGIADAMKDTGINIGGLIKNTLSRATNYKMDDSGKITGTWGAPKPTQQAADYAENKGQFKRTLGQFGSSLAGVVLGYGNAGKKGEEKPTGDKLGQATLASSEKSNTQLEQLNAKIEKLTDAILKTKK